MPMGERREDAAADAEVGSPHVTALLGIVKAKGQFPEVIRGHELPFLAGTSPSQGLTTGDSTFASRARSQRPSGCLRWIVMRSPASRLSSPPPCGNTESESRLSV